MSVVREGFTRQSNEAFYKWFAEKRDNEFTPALKSRCDEEGIPLNILTGGQASMFGADIVYLLGAFAFALKCDGKGVVPAHLGMVNIRSGEG